MARSPTLARIVPALRDASWRSALDARARWLAGHAWTFGAMADERFLRVRPPPRSVPWTTDLRDPDVGRVVLTGKWRRRGSPTLVLVVHGMGGDADSYYVHRAARVVEAAGFDSLRLNLRGADQEGWDFYHAGLTADLHAALQSAAFDRYRHVIVLGYSLGGHLALRYAAEAVDPRVRAVIAVCAPLDLARARHDLDRPGARPYRRYVIASLHAVARANARRRRLPCPLREILAVRSARGWFETVVRPRFGFADLDAYVRAASVHHHLDSIHLPSLLVNARDDPMVDAATHDAVLPAHHPHVRRIEVPRAGHLGFAQGLDLGVDAPRGLERQVLGWAAGHAPEDGPVGKG